LNLLKEKCQKQEEKVEKVEKKEELIEEIVLEAKEEKKEEVKVEEKKQDNIEDKFSQELNLLKNMGFSNEILNLHLLYKFGGKIEKVVEMLLKIK